MDMVVVTQALVVALVVVVNKLNIKPALRWLNF